MEKFVLDTILAFFNLEIANKVEVEDNNIIVYLANGTKAKIEIKKTV